MFYGSWNFVPFRICCFTCITSASLSECWAYRFSFFLKWCIDLLFSNASSPTPYSSMSVLVGPSVVVSNSCSFEACKLDMCGFCHILIWILHLFHIFNQWHQIQLSWWSIALQTTKCGWFNHKTSSNRCSRIVQPFHGAFLTQIKMNKDNNNNYIL